MALASVRFMILGALSVFGCSCVSAKSDPTQAQYVPAVLAPASSGALAEIRDVVAKQLNTPRANLMMANDVLTSKDVLIIDHAHPVMGDRALPRPDHFRLQMNANNCYLLHEESQTRYKLKSAHCVAY